MVRHRTRFLKNAIGAKANERTNQAATILPRAVSSLVGGECVMADAPKCYSSYLEYANLRLQSGFALWH